MKADVNEDTGQIDITMNLTLSQIMEAYVEAVIDRRYSGMTQYYKGVTLSPQELPSLMREAADDIEEWAKAAKVKVNDVEVN
jgi:hypothetical protein